MPPIEEYLENAPKLAQNILNEWGTNMLAGNGPLLSQEFQDLNEYACRYIKAKDLADNHRRFSEVTEEDAAYEAATRRTFAEKYKTYLERLSAKQQRPALAPK